MTTLKINPVSFDAAAMSIVKTMDKADRAYIKATAEVARVMQTYIDTWFVANGKTEPSVKAMGKAIRESQAVLDLVAQGACEKKTFTEYAQSAMRALHYGVPFAADLKNNPEMGLPWGKAGKGSEAVKAGKVTSTTRADADKTLSKALAQYRALGLTEFAAGLLDLALDSLDGFKETMLDK